MGAASTSETLVNFYQTTWHNNPEDSHLHTCCCENLKSHMNKNESPGHLWSVVFLTEIYFTSNNSANRATVEIFTVYTVLFKLYIKYLPCV
jgi:hypothetical protein